ncbi:MAG: hypothetical protein ABMA13_18705 [Chthoniobacteraceae bacterium]
MKTTRTFAAVLIFTLLTAPAPAIDFTLNFTDTVDDGVPIKRMYFSDGPRRIYYHPPASWARSGDARAAIFHPKDSTQASVTIQASPAEQARIRFDAGGLKSLREIALAMVPAGATEVSEVWEMVNPVVLQGWTSFEIGLDYVHFGRRFCRSILLINLDAERQISFTIDADPSEFQPLYKTTYRTLATWWEPAAGDSQ